MNGKVRSTTVLAVRRNNDLVMVSDGQVTVGATVVKGTARKVRRLCEGNVVAGFAGSAADGLALFEKLEGKLNEYSENLPRAAVEMAKDWRMDRVLRRLDALLLVADGQRTFLLSGAGDVLEPDEGVVAIGSGGNYALAAARALMDNTDLSAKEVAQKAMSIAGDICIYTNDQLSFEELSA